MNPIRVHLPLLARHEGLWEGEYRHVAPDLALQDRHRFRIRVQLPDAGPVHYRQTSDYAWDDGRTQHLEYGAAYRDGAVAFDDGRIRGRLVAVDEETLYLRFAFAADAEGHVCEMIQLSPDGARRARTWHWFRRHVLWRITLVDERRVG